MSRFFLGSIFILTLMGGNLLPVFAQTPVYEVEHVLSSSPVDIYDVSAVKIVNQKTDVSQPLRSWAEVEISGEFDGRFCGYTEVAVFPRSLKRQMGVEETELSFLGVSQKSKLELGPFACTLQYIPQPFSTHLKLRPLIWNSAQKQYTWVFTVPLYGGKPTPSQSRRVEVRFSLTQGWSAKLL